MILQLRRRERVASIGLRLEANRLPGKHPRLRAQPKAVVQHASDWGEWGSIRTVTGSEAAKIGGVRSLESLARGLKRARCGQKPARLMEMKPP